MSDNAGTRGNMRVDPDTCRDPDLLAAEVRRLRGVIAAGEASPASDGSVAGKPVAWATLFCGSPLVVSRFKQICDDEAHYQGDVAAVIPLYRSPTLTDAEREAIEASREFWQVEAACELRDETDQKHADTLRGLLERLG